MKFNKKDSFFYAQDVFNICDNMFATEKLQNNFNNLKWYFKTEWLQKLYAYNTAHKNEYNTTY